MKKVLLLLLAFTLSFSSFAQHTIQLRNLWVRPQVHVIFHGYSLSFTIKDINRAMELLLETGDSTFGPNCGLDTAGDYVVELYAGLHQEYRNKLQILLQKGVGAYLLTAGHAYILNGRSKRLSAIVTDIQPLMEGVTVTTVKFSDPATNTLLFEGLLVAGMYHKDLGIE